MHIAVSYLALELRGAAHARLVAPSLAIPLRARLSVSRSAARGMRPRRESDPSPPAQAPESPYFPRFEAELGEMRENGPRQPPGAAWFPRVTRKQTNNSLILLRAANKSDLRSTIGGISSGPGSSTQQTGGASARENSELAEIRLRNLQAIVQPRRSLLTRNPTGSIPARDILTEKFPGTWSSIEQWKSGRWWLDT
jgi:hypothetical protein